MGFYPRGFSQSPDGHFYKPVLSLRLNSVYQCSSLRLRENLQSLYALLQLPGSLPCRNPL